MVKTIPMRARTCPECDHVGLMALEFCTNCGTKYRDDRIPPDHWVMKLRKIFGISDDATWDDILIECGQTKRLALRATKEFIATQGQKE